MNSTKSILYFLHSPKTGGKSIEHNFCLAFGDDILRVSRSFPDISVGDIFEYQTAFKEGAIIPEHTRVIAGHFCYGLHKSIDRPATYFSIIRDPVDRLKSYYNYILNSKPYFIRDFIIENKITFSDLVHLGDSYQINNYPKEFDIMVENGQTRLISGFTGNLEDAINDGTFTQALRNIEDNFIFIAPTEETTKAMVAAYCFMKKRPSLRYMKLNVSKKDHVGDIPSDLRNYILERNQYDQKLHDLSKISFEKFKQKNRISISKSYLTLKSIGYLYELIKKTGL